MEGARRADVIERARRFAEDVVEPGADRWELDRTFADEAFSAAARYRLTGLLAPVELGGEGLGPVDLAAVLEIIAAADMAVAFSLVVHNNLVGSVCRNGSDRQRAAVLPPMIAGERVGAFLLTEPGTGSDAAAIECRAVRDGSGWVVDGEKAWVTNAARADLLSVYAQTDPSAGHRGIIALLIDADQPGVVRHEPYELLGAHAMGTGGFTFDAVRVDDDDVLVPAGSAFRAAMEGIDLARLLVAAMCCGVLARGLDTAVAHTARRHAFGEPVADKQGIRWMLADVATDLEAMRLLTARAAGLLEAGEPASLAAAHAKKFAARATVDGLSTCMQALGAAGYRRDTPLPRHLTTARMAHYIDGTTEIQNVVIARHLWTSVDSDRRPTSGSPRLD